MQKFISIAILLLLGSTLYAQDYLSVPLSNPSLHDEEAKGKINKSFFLTDSLVYEFDTLDLPFIDDFTDDHFPTLVTDPLNDPRVTDTLYYAIRELNNDVYQGVGFMSDTTFTYYIDTSSSTGDTINRQPNPFVNIFFSDLNSFPPTLELLTVYPPYDILDSASGGIDTIALIPNVLQDSARFYVVEKDTNAFYVNRDVYLNNTLGFYPPSIGVVTFDGLDKSGLPYNFNDITNNGQADYLTSIPIRLGGTSDSTYFSFFYQAKGFALDGPDIQDSLSLEFYNSNTQRWGLIWQSQGLPPTAAADSFKQVIVRVDSQFRTNAFQFRFRNRAKLTGAFDHWHVDYIYLNDNRSARDTSYKDIAFVYPSSGTLEEYTAMPSWHFKLNPSLYMADSIFFEVRNNGSDPLNVFNKIVFPDTTNPPANYFSTSPSQFLGILPYGNISRGYDISSFSYPSADIDSSQVFKGRLDIDFRPAPIETKDFIRANDTIFSYAVLKDYYAYDDGTAEAAYGINAGSQGGNKSFMAVRFEMPFKDTIGGVQMYFLPQANDIRNQKFKLTIWSSLNPPNIIFQKEVDNNALYGKRDGYITYWFDSLVVADPIFFVGFEKTGPLSMNVGYDFNRNHRDKISWSLDGFNWFSPSNNIFDGSLMIRPILRKRAYGVGINEIADSKKAKRLNIYPNPASNEFFINQMPSGIERLQLFAVDGRMVKEYTAFQYRFSLEGLESGLYFLKAQDVQGGVYTAKIICRQQ